MSCGDSKPIDKFYENRGKKRLSSHCKECTKEKSKARYYSKKQEIAEQHREAKYGLKRNQYQQMLQAQQGCCAICKAPEPRGGRKHFNVDHDHVSGEVRGLLCISCNTGLGQFKDNIQLLDAAKLYLQENKWNPL